MRRSSSNGSTAALLLRTTPSRVVSGSNVPMSVATSAMDFNVAPDDHIQEVLGAAKQDLKRLRDKVNKARDKDRSLQYFEHCIRFLLHSMPRNLLVKLHSTVLYGIEYEICNE